MYKDFPFHDVVKKAEELVKQGVTIHQKFTCHGCGQRLTIGQPNVFHTQGTCDKCSTVTDIEKQGCNYLIKIGGVTTSGEAVSKKYPEE